MARVGITAPRNGPHLLRKTLGPLTTIQIKGKGRKQRAVPLLKPVATDLKRYLADLPGETFAPLFTNCFGQNLTRSGVEKRLRLVVELAAEKCGSLKGRSILIFRSA